MRLLEDMQKTMRNRKPPEYVRDKHDQRVKIAVLDTGVDSTHNSIKAAKKGKRITILQSYVDGDSSSEDSCGHGTHVATLLLKVAPEAHLYIAKVASGNKIPPNHKIADVSLFIPPVSAEGGSLSTLLLRLSSWLQTSMSTSLQCLSA